MRKCLTAGGVSAHWVRYVRRRGVTPARTPIVTSDSPQLQQNEVRTQGLTHGSYEYSTSSTVDALRSQLALMRAELNYQEFERRIAEESQPNRPSSSANETAESYTSPQPRPSFSVRTGAIGDSAACRSTFVQKKWENDVNEVLRSKDPRHALRLSCYLPEAAPQVSAKALDAFRRLRDRVHQIQRRRGTTVVNEAVIVEAVEELGDEDVLTLTRSGLLDPAYFVPSSTTPASTDDATAEEEAGNDVSDAFRIVDGLEPVVDLTKSLARDLVGEPDEDIAVLLVKARSRDYSRFSESDIQKLERYEQSQQAADRITSGSPNLLLWWMAQKNPTIAQSLDKLDKIRRDALLDASFDDALHYIARRREEQFRSLTGVKVSRRKKAAEIPHFFGNAKSIPPPRANMNIPEPRTQEFKRLKRKANRTERRRFHK